MQWKVAVILLLILTNFALAESFSIYPIENREIYHRIDFSTKSSYASTGIKPYPCEKLQVLTEIPKKPCSENAIYTYLRFETYYTNNKNSLSIIPDREGIRLSEDTNFFTTLGGYYSPTDFLNITYNLRFSANEDTKKLYVHRLALNLKAGNTVITVGKDNIKVGPSRYGNLFSGTNPPFFQVRVQNYYPYEFLGHFDYIFMFGKLYEEREDHSDPNILFLRLNFKPSTSVEIGLNRAVMYGGKGRPQYKLKEYPKLIIGREETIGGRFENDSYFGFDVKFDIPIKFFDVFQIYYERNATDIESPMKKGDPKKLHFPFIIVKFHDDAKTYGIRVKRGKMLVNAEYTETAKTMYIHHRYPKEGFTYRGFSLGYPYGRNVRHAFLLLESLGDKEKFSVELGYIGQPAKFRGSIERRRMESVYTAFNVGKKVNKFNLDLYFRVDNVKNLNLSETPVQINLTQSSKLLFSTGFAVSVDF